MHAAGLVSGGRSGLVSGVAGGPGALIAWGGRWCPPTAELVPGSCRTSLGAALGAHSPRDRRCSWQDWPEGGGGCDPAGGAEVWVVGKGSSHRPHSGPEGLTKD